MYYQRILNKWWNVLHRYSGYNEYPGFSMTASASPGASVKFYDNSPSSVYIRYKENNRIVYKTHTLKKEGSVYAIQLNWGFSDINTVYYSFIGNRLTLVGLQNLSLSFTNKFNHLTTLEINSGQIEHLTINGLINISTIQFFGAKFMDEDTAVLFANSVPSNSKGIIRLYFVDYSSIIKSILEEKGWKVVSL